MSSQPLPAFTVDRYVVIHVATTCDEHGVYVTKDSAEVIELGWILIDANTLEEVSILSLPHGAADAVTYLLSLPQADSDLCIYSLPMRVCL